MDSSRSGLARTVESPKNGVSGLEASMKRYKVTVADKETGRDEATIIDGEDQSDAERKATESGLIWSAVVPEESSCQAEATAQPSITVPTEPSHAPSNAVLEMLWILRASRVCNLPKQIAVRDYEVMLLLGAGLMFTGCCSTCCRLFRTCRPEWR